MLRQVLKILRNICRTMKGGEKSVAVLKNQVKVNVGRC